MCATRAATRRWWWPGLSGADALRRQVLAAITAGFEAAYRQRFAFLMQGKGLVVEAVSVEAVVAGDAPAEPRHALHPPREVPRREHRADLLRRPVA